MPRAHRAWHLSLRRSLMVESLVLGAAAIAVFVVLTWTTVEEHRINEDNTKNLESVRLAEEAKIDVLLLTRTTAPAARTDLANHLARTLDAAKPYATTEAELLDVARVRADVDAYLSGASSNADAAYDAIGALIALNSRQAAESISRGRVLDHAAVTLAFAVGAIVVLVVGVFLWWVQRRGVWPIFAIGEAMSRFGRGDHSARAPELGAAEIRAMAVRFNQMASSLAEHRRAQMTFLASVAHDLKNPVAVLRLAVGRIDDASSREVVQDTNARISRQLTRLERMIGDFLDTATVEAGTLELKMSLHDCGRLVQQATDLFEGSTAAHQIVVRTPDEPLLLRCDPLRIEQVVTNLVSNAIKYSQPDTTIEVGVDRENDDVVISVTDHGIGISPADQTHLFEPFRRVGLSKETVSGVGLGLYVVRRLVEAQGGHIDVVSKPARGSTFKVYLPCVGGDHASAMQRGQPREKAAT